MSVSMTEAAARHVNRYLTKRGKGVGVRLGVKTTGCSGLAYKLEYVDDLTLKNSFPNDVSRYRNVGGIQFDMIPNWKFPNGDDRNRRARENNRVEFGRAVRR